MINKFPTQEELIGLWLTCSKFIEEQRIHCEETIYQCDWVSENSSQFIEDICDIVGYKEIEEE